MLMDCVRASVAYLALKAAFAASFIAKRKPDSESDTEDLLLFGLSLAVAIGAFFAVRWWWIALPPESRAEWTIAMGIVVVTEIASQVAHYSQREAEDWE